MIKNISKFVLMLALALFASCSQGADEPVPASGTETPDAEMSSVTMAISRAAADDLMAAGISQFIVYVYQVQRGGSPLAQERVINVADGNFTLEFPLGESFQTFAVANAASISDKETFETVKVNLDPNAGNEVFIATPVRFASDKSVNEVALVLRRMVGQINFTPAETAQELAAQTDFDRLDLTFYNVATSYLVSKQSVEPTDIRLTTDASKGYATSFTTFETTSLDENGSLMIDYFKNGVQVNTSSTPLDCGVKYEASKRYAMKVPVTDPGFILEPWARSTGKLTVEVSDF